MGEQKKGRKVVNLSYHLSYGGDQMVDKNGISTENHMQMWYRLVKDGPRMHSHPGSKKGK